MFSRRRIVPTVLAALLIVAELYRIPPSTSLLNSANQVQTARSINHNGAQNEQLRAITRYPPCFLRPISATAMVSIRNKGISQAA